MEIASTVNKALALPIVVLLLIYQKTISLDHGLFSMLNPSGWCKFYPSCSMYAKQTLLKHGIIALPKVIRRILACNPWREGGVDLP